MTKTEAAVRAHPLTGEVSDERHLDSGVWVYLKHGHCDGEMHPTHSAENCRHSVREDTWTDCLRALRRIAKHMSRTRCVDDY